MRKSLTVSERILAAPTHYPHFAAYWANKQTAAGLRISGRYRNGSPTPTWRVTSYHFSEPAAAVRRQEMLGMRDELWRWWLEEWERLGAGEDEARRAWNGEAPG